MAILADIIGRNMRRGFAGGCRAIMTGHTSSSHAGMAERRGRPCRG
jgi:hypothetical protein